MIVRSGPRCSRRLLVRRLHVCRSQGRSFSASNPTGAASAGYSASPTAALAALRKELDDLAPRFEIQASQIHVLQSPDDFYQTLKAKISKAKRRIYISTLYIGKSEHELIETLQSALRNQPKLRVSILTDALRGTREQPNPSCASLLAPLISEFGPERVEIRMYHTPNLTGLRKKYIPKRINEGWGLQHMKLYGVDDEIILSGANLSNDYFTNRQDRYHVFSCKQITDYFSRIHDAVCSFSFLVRPDENSPAGFALTWPTENRAPSPLKDPKHFIAHAGDVIRPLIQPSKGSEKPPLFENADTVVYPLGQFTPLLLPDSSTERPGLTAILRTISGPAFAGCRWTFTQGYFNILPELRDLLLSSPSTNGVVITASPWANGFYGSKGVSGLLPPAYTLLSRRFLESIHSAGRDGQIVLKEWRKGTVGEPEGWTYHAKGLWITLPQQETPSITLIGSSNYTKRSYTLDLEVNALVATHNEALRKRLGQEERWLQKYAKEIDLDEFTRPERRVSLVVRIAMWITTMVGGAL